MNDFHFGNGAVSLAFSLSLLLSLLALSLFLTPLMLDKQMKKWCRNKYTVRTPNCLHVKFESRCWPMNNNNRVGLEQLFCVCFLLSLVCVPILQNSAMAHKRTDCKFRRRRRRRQRIDTNQIRLKSHISRNTFNCHNICNFLLRGWRIQSVKKNEEPISDANSFRFNLLKSEQCDDIDDDSDGDDHMVFLLFFVVRAIIPFPYTLVCMCAVSIAIYMRNMIRSCERSHINSRLRLKIDVFDFSL